MTPETLGKPQTEHAQQVAFFAWCAIQSKTDPRFKWVHAIPNGGERNKIVASRMKSEGVRSGVADVFLPIPCGQWHGLYIEFKKPGLENHKNGGLKPEQLVFRDFALSQNFGYFVAYSWLQAKETVLNYLSHK